MLAFEGSSKYLCRLRLLILVRYNAMSTVLRHFCEDKASSLMWVGHVLSLIAGMF